MRHLAAAMMITTLTATGAMAGGVDRSGQPVDALFKTGTFVELSFGMLTPDVSGVQTTGGGAQLASGNVAPAVAFQVAGLAFKKDFGSRVSLALTVDQPFGAEVDFNTPGYPLYGAAAHFKTTSLSFLGLYRLNDSFSVIGGIRAISAEGDVTRSSPAFTSTYSPDTDVAYVLGGAYEKPEIALRLAVTYSSATKFTLKGTGGTATADMPQSVNVDFQTGIAADTLVIASARWADWSHAAIMDSTIGSLATYDANTVSYTLGVGRKFTEAWSGAVLLGYEAPSGAAMPELTPTDGYSSVTLAAIYTKGRVKVTGGVLYRKFGNARTDKLGADFSGNSEVGVGLKLAVNF